MKEERYFYVPQAAQKTELPIDEAQHAAKVLRMEAGDEIVLMDGEGRFFSAILTMVSPKHCFYEIRSQIARNKAWRGSVRLAIAPTKNMDRIEWMTEKCTEIGWDRVSFIQCRFSERKQIRTDRVEKIVVSAAKQSRKPFMPSVDEMVSLSEFIAADTARHKYICHCYNEVPKEDFFSVLKTCPAEDDVTILVGPEGDFSIEEVHAAIEAGYVSVTLGDFRLRTETAGLMAVTMYQLAQK